MKTRTHAILFPEMQPRTGCSSPQVVLANQYSSLEVSLIELRKFFEAVFSVHRHELSGELSVVFMDRSAHSKLHGKYLHDYRPTDVITFPADEENELAGEICVSVDQAIEESQKRNLSFNEEMSLYLIHGWLHLLGFDDLEKVDREIMRLEEQRVMDHVNHLSALPDFRLAQKRDE